MLFTWDRRYHRSEWGRSSRTGGWRAGRATGGLLGLSLATAMLTAATGHSADAAAPARLTSKSRVSTQGLGPVRIGMTKAAAERAARMPMRYSGTARFSCRYMRPADARIRASFMLHRGRVVRVDVGRRGIATPSGVRVGDYRILGAPPVRRAAPHPAARVLRRVLPRVRADGLGGKEPARDL